MLMIDESDLPFDQIEIGSEATIARSWPLGRSWDPHEDVVQAINGLECLIFIDFQRITERPATTFSGGEAVANNATSGPTGTRILQGTLPILAGDEATSAHAK